VEGLFAQCNFFSGFRLALRIFDFCTFGVGFSTGGLPCGLCGGSGGGGGGGDGDGGGGGCGGGCGAGVGGRAKLWYGCGTGGGGTIG
jgi:hypothetical protein